MKYIRCCLLVFAMALLMGTAVAQQTTGEPLGDVARRNRSAKKTAAPAKRVVTNDDLRSTAQPEQDAASPVASPKTKEDDGPEAFKKKQQEFRTRYAAEMEKLDKLQAEHAALEKEYAQRVSGFYTDAGNRLRDDKNWADKQRKLEADMAAKQKQIAEAKQAMENLKEEVRRAGLPERTIED